MSRIHDALRRGSQFGAPVSAQVIEGVGGVGKTRAAVEYAWTHRNDYSALLLINAESPDILTNDFAALTGVLDLPEQTANDAAIRVSATVAWLNAHPGWLLIFDNVDTDAAARAVGTLLGQLSGGHALLTSRRRGFAPGVEAIALDVLNADDATAMLLTGTAGNRLTTAADTSEAAAVAEALGNLPLALEMAAATIRQRHCSIADYRHIWRDARKALTGRNESRIAGYNRNVDVALLEAADTLPQEARALMERLAFFAADPIPASLIGVAVPPAGSVDAAQEALQTLITRSLVSRSPDGTAFTVNRLVQDAIRRGLDAATTRLTVNEALSWIAAAFVADSEDVRNWPLLDPLAPHVEAIVWAADKIGIAEPTAQLMDHLGRLLQSKGQFAPAEPLMRRALAIEKASLGADHPTVAIRLNDLARLLQDTNRLAEAESLMRRALAIDEATLGADHPNVAIRLSNLARLLHDTNLLAEAEPLMRRALALGEASLGANHPRMATRLNNLARLLHDTNRLAEAEPLMRRALAIDEASLGADHPNVAIRLNNLALLLKGTNRLTEAEPLVRRALAIDEASLGADHPNVATDLNNLAQLLKATNRLAEAEPLMRRALSIDEASRGGDHPNVATDLNNLAHLLYETNRLAEAEPLMRRALAIDEARLGTDHPTVAGRLTNLAQLLQATNRLAEAEPLMRRALTIDEASLGADHPTVARDLNNLARLLQDTNRVAEAEPLIRRALAIDEASLGADHPEVAINLNNLALLLRATNRLAEAEPLMRRALAIFLAFQRDTGHPHPHRDVMTANYTSLLSAMGRDQTGIKAAIADAHREAGLI